jgi:malate dehydrogenase (oxaloacetate-decarboxylating)(NADP+)
MHDDQHGTHISSALLNTQLREDENAKIIVSGAGSAALACAFICSWG